MQLSLFDSVPIVRSSDNATSHMAAEYIETKVGCLQSVFLDRLGDSSKTANEIAQGEESIRKRAKELVRLGVIAEVGERKCSVTGRMATIYKASR